ILTDGFEFEFFFFDFRTWSVQRGMGSAEAGISWNKNCRLSLPSERAPDYLAQLKVIVEVIFDEFIDSYIVGLEAQVEYSSADLANTVIPHLGEGVMRRESTGYWERAYSCALTAGRMLREAQHMRVTDPYYADEIARR